MSPLKPYGSPARRANPCRTSNAVEEPNANDPPSEHVARLPFKSHHEVNDLRPHSAEARSNGRVVIGAVRRDLRTCLADAQAMAFDRAGEDRDKATDAASSAQNPLSSDRHVDSIRHDTCSIQRGTKSSGTELLRALGYGVTGPLGPHDSLDARRGPRIPGPRRVRVESPTT